MFTGARWGVCAYVFTTDSPLLPRFLTFAGNKYGPPGGLLGGSLLLELATRGSAIVRVVTSGRVVCGINLVTGNRYKR